MGGAAETPRPFGPTTSDGGKPKTIDAYIASKPEEIQPILRSVRAAIAEAIPEASERIAWGMPTFWHGAHLIHFAAAKRHIGLYPTPNGVRQFADELEMLGLSCSKATVRVPYDRELPLDLIARMAKWCWEAYAR